MAGPTVGATATVSSVAAASGTTSSVTTAASGSDFLVFIHSSVFNGTHSVSDNKGNTYTNKTLSGSNEAANGDMVFVFACENGAGGTGHTFTIGASGASGTFNPIGSVVCEVKGALSSSGFDLLVCNAQLGGGSTTVPASTGTTSTANELVLSFAGGPNTGGGTPESLSSAGTFTSLVNVTSGGFSPSLALTSFAAATTGTYGDTFTGSISDAYVSATVSLKPASGGGGPAPAAGTLSLAGSAPKTLLATLLFPAVAALALAGYAPTVSVSGGSTRQPVTGALGLSGGAPQIVRGTVLPVPTGALALAGSAPTVVRGLVIAPPSGALIITTQTGPALLPGAGTLSLTGFSPSLLLATTIRPGAGALGLAGLIPQFGGSSISLAPGAGALGLTGAAPIVGRGSIITPTTGALILTTQTGATITPPAGALTLTGSPPQFGGASITVTPGAGSLSLAGQQPVQTLTLAAPAAGAVALSGSPPVVISGIVRIPVAGSLSLLGAAPQFASPTLIAPAAGSLAFAGNAPVVGRGIGIPSAALSLSGSAPSVNVSITIVPTTGALSLAGAAPNILVPATRPGVGSLSLAGFAPQIGIGTFVPAGALGLAGAAPSVIQSITITPAAGQLGLTGFGPAVTQFGLRQPGVGSLGLVGFAPTLSLSGGIVPAGGALVVTGYPPNVGLSLYVQPPAGQLTLVGAATVRAQNVLIAPGPASLSLLGGAPGLHFGAVYPPTGAIALVGSPPSIKLSIYQGTPGYVVKRLRTRRWIVSRTSYLQFDSKEPDEAIKLTFDLSPDLATGVTLTGLPVVTFEVEEGADPNPGSLANGSAAFNATATQIIVPVIGGVNRCDYKIHVMCSTTDAQTILSLTGILSVRS